MGLFAAALSAKVREPEVREIVASINTSVEALERLFSALMDISKLDAGAVAPMRAPCPLAPLFVRLERQFAPLAAAAGCACASCRPAPAVDSDPVLLERILANLVGNAIHYTERGGVVVGARRRAGQLRIDVVDSGIGIAAMRITSASSTSSIAADGASGSGRHGMGLGLAIVRRLARAARPPALARLGAGPRLALFGVRASRDGPRCRQHGPNISDHTPTRATSLRGALIVVVDDDANGRRRHARLLHAVGCDGARGGDRRARAQRPGRLRPISGPHRRRLSAGRRRNWGRPSSRDCAMNSGCVIPALLVSGDASADAIAAMRAFDAPGAAQAGHP